MPCPFRSALVPACLFLALLASPARAADAVPAQIIEVTGCGATAHEAIGHAVNFLAEKTDQGQRAATACLLKAVQYLDATQSAGEQPKAPGIISIPKSEFTNVK